MSRWIYVGVKGYCMTDVYGGINTIFSARGIQISRLDYGHNRHSNSYQREKTWESLWKYGNIYQRYLQGRGHISGYGNVLWVSGISCDNLWGG